MTRRFASPSRRRLLRPRDGPRRGHPALDLAKPCQEARPAADEALRALVDENLLLVRELARVQQRSSQWRDECVARIERLDAQLMRSRARCIAKDTQVAALRESLEALRKRTSTWLTNEELLRRLSDLRARNRSLECELAESRRATDALAPAGDARIPAANAERACAPPTSGAP